MEALDLKRSLLEFLRERFVAIHNSILHDTTSSRPIAFLGSASIMLVSPFAQRREELPAPGTQALFGLEHSDTNLSRYG